jgi:hypothetical protein
LILILIEFDVILFKNLFLSFFLNFFFFFFGIAYFDETEPKEKLDTFDEFVDAMWTSGKK